MIFIDYEYRDTAEKNLDLVACVTQRNKEKPNAWLLYQRSEIQKQLSEYLLKHKNEILVSFNATAEARAMLSHDLDPINHRWLDLLIAFRMFLNSPHTQVEKRTASLISCCKTFGVKYGHIKRKDELRDLILTNKSFSKEELKDIMLYCADDVKVLPELFIKLLNGVSNVYNIEPKSLIKLLNYHSLFSVSMAYCEKAGIPINMTAMTNLMNNYKLARFSIVEDCSYPFYEFNEKRNDYVRSYLIFKDFIESNNLIDGWPKTDKGFFAADSDSLKRQSNKNLHIKSLQNTEKLLSQLRSFNPKRSKMRDNIGADERLRPYFNPFGTQTGRNAPPASFFIFALSSVFRSLIKAPADRVITGIDWGSQEFAIAAALSDDQVMLDAYYSGDPYLYFGKAAGAIPQDGTKKEYSKERQLFKSTTLGLQYGMGKYSLAEKLTADMGEEVSVKQATELINLHKKVYRSYWAWVKQIDKKIKSQKPLFTKDGWYIQTHSKYINSLRNFLVQGTGASIMRLAVILAIKKGLTVVSPLHDAIYIEHGKDDTESVELLKRIMDKAVQTYFPGLKIRLDTETHSPENFWVEEKAEKVFTLFKEFYQEKPAVNINAYIRPELETFNLEELM